MATSWAAASSNSWRQPAAGMCQHVHPGRLDRPAHARRLIVGRPEIGMHRREHELDRTQLGACDIQRAVGEDVRLDALDDVQRPVEILVDAVDLALLRRHVFRRHAARDSQPLQ
jgi:hypothetical protein